VGKTICSYPLAMKFDPDGKLVVADGSGGLMRLDVDSGKNYLVSYNIFRVLLFPVNSDLIPELSSHIFGAMYFSTGLFKYSFQRKFDPGE